MVGVQCGEVAIYKRLQLVLAREDTPNLYDFGHLSKAEGREEV